MTKIALFGAGGKMGMRLGANLKNSRYTVSPVEVSDAGKARLRDELGWQADSTEHALDGAEIVVLAVPDTPVPERVRTLVELLVPSTSEALTAEDEADLEEAVMAFDAAGGRADLSRYQRAVERASLRVGLLLCGDLKAAIAMCEMLPSGVLSKADWVDELCRFLVCDRYRELRERIGAA